MGSYLKQGALQALKSAGLFSVSTRFRRKDTLVILCYHGISLRDEHHWEGGLYMPPDRFRAALQWLREWKAQVLPLREGLTRLGAGTLPPRSVVITFDDGFYDFYCFALPLLLEFGFPATLYLTTFYSHYRLPIFNLAARYLLWKGRQTAKKHEGPHLELTSILRRADAGLSTNSKDDLAREIASRLNVDYDAILKERLFQIMSPDEVSEASRAGIDIQLHTHRHRTPLNRELFLKEIDDNIRDIEAMTGRSPRHFCYPSGVTSPDFLPWLRERGIQSATTCCQGLARPASDPLMLPRYLDGCGVQRLDFEAWLSGVR